MEEIIIAMLFLYPGALIDVFDKRFFPRHHKESVMSDSTRVAKYFVYSVFISVFSLLIYAHLTGRGVSNINAIQDSLAGTMEIPKYFGVSLICTILFTLILRVIDSWFLQLRSLYKHSIEGTTLINATDVWHEIVRGSDLKEIRSCMIAKIENGTSIRAGFLQYMPDDFEEGLGLTASQLVMDQLECEKGLEPSSDKCYIGPPWLSYYDTKTGAFVDIYDGRRLHEYLNKTKPVAEKTVTKKD